MALSRIIKKIALQQAGNPSGLIGRLLIARSLNKRNAPLNDLAFDTLALSQTDRVLEVGFGGGYLINRLSAIVTEGFVAGVDTSRDMLDFCKKRNHSIIQAGRLELKCAPAESLPYPSSHFNKICTVNSIFYWQSVPAALSEFHRVLADNGELVMCFTTKEFMEKQGYSNYGIALYESNEVQQMMKTAGFHDISTIHATDPRKMHRNYLCMCGKKKNA